MKKIISILIIIFTLVNISGCIEKKVTGKEEQADLTCRIKKLPDDLMSDMDESLSFLLFDGLFIEEEGKIKNSLCSSYTVSNENKCYDFNIKKGMLFSTGETLNAMDFKVYFEYLKEKGLFNNAKSIKALDLNTLRIELVKEDKNFIKRLSDPVFLLRDIDDKGMDIKGRFNNLHYSGPYTISFVSEKYILLKKNDHYYNKKLAAAESVKMLIEPLDEMALAMFDEGKIDILSCPIEEQAGKKVTLPSSIDIVFNSNEIFKTQQEREGLIFKLRERLKLLEGREWTLEAKDAKQSDINNILQYKESINILCQDKNYSLYAENIRDILIDNGYKAKVTEKGSEENQISVQYEKSENLPDVYPIISKNVYLYNKDVDGYYFTGSGTLVLIKANKKLP
ncbi:MAG: ABC transporter substrate-binding protein [Clostridiaceae bacterium]